jgi:hypothetical protein
MPSIFKDIRLKDTLENRRALPQAFVSCGMGDFPMIEYMQFIPGWTEFHLNNELRLDILIDLKGLEGYNFDECLQMASVADIENVKIHFLHINQLISTALHLDRQYSSKV